MAEPQRIALVTGANRGIGLEVCRQLAECGLRVVLTARDPLPDEAAVAEVFGTLPVWVAVILMRSRGSISSSATTCATLMNRPWPISVPPWLTSTEPSV